MPSELDLSKPRQVIYQSFESAPGPCPRCGGRLRQSRQTYYVATRRKHKLLDAFVMGSDFGWYCDTCPVVVIDGNAVRETLSHPLSHWKVGNEFCIEGIVDLDAIPEHKRHLPIGGADNPVPLIAFESADAPSRRPPLNREERQRRRKLLARKRKPARGKVLRNQETG